MKKLVIRDGACIGCGACVSIDPEHFEFSDDGLAIVTSQENLESEALKNAIEACPTDAIEIKEEE